jgi:putrescine aminotransferase
MGALSVSGRERFRAPFAPLLQHTHRVPFGDPDALESAIEKADGRCAVILEPIQAEAGVVIPPAGYLASVRQTCDRQNAVLIMDEISTGLGRTGRQWCMDYDDVQPDILILGKALGGGLVPTSAIVTTPRLFAPLNRDPLLHSATFSGNPLAAAAVTATLDVIAAIDVPGKAAAIGERLLGEMQAIALEHMPSLVVDVRGRGLLIGVAMAKEHFAAELMLELLERRVIVSHSLYAHSVVRFTPPAILDAEANDWLLNAFADSLDAVAARYKTHAPGQRPDGLR